MQAVKGAVEKVKEHLPGAHHQEQTTATEHGTGTNTAATAVAQTRDPLADIDGVERYDEHLQEGQLPRGANSEEYSERGGAVMPDHAAGQHTETPDEKLRDVPTLAGTDTSGGGAGGTGAQAAEWPGHQVNALSPATGPVAGTSTAPEHSSLGTGDGAGWESGATGGAADIPAPSSQEGENGEKKEGEVDMRKVWDERNHHPGPKWGTPGTVPDEPPKHLLNHGVELPNP